MYRLLLLCVSAPLAFLLQTSPFRRPPAVRTLRVSHPHNCTLVLHTPGVRALHPLATTMPKAPAPRLI